jgi:hypothetical protein
MDEEGEILGEWPKKVDCGENVVSDVRKFPGFNFYFWSSQKLNKFIYKITKKRVRKQREEIEK